MCKAFEEERAEGKMEGKLEERISILTAMQENGFSIEQIAKMVNIPEEEVKQLLNE